jgi:protein TonB
MKNSKKDFNTAGQSSAGAMTSHKHDANLQKNSTLYFQIGLILCLLGTYALFEMQFQKTAVLISEETSKVEPIAIDYVPPYVVEVIKPKVPEPVRSVDLKDVYTPVENDVPIEEAIVKTPEEPKTSDAPAADPGSIFDGKIAEEPIEVPFYKVEKVPVYPGCEKYSSNAERKSCMSEKIAKLVGKTFNVDVGADYGISGRQRINTQFTVDHNGTITNIKIRGPHHALETEAKRVINKIPKMKPGFQRSVPVGVIYTLPIVFDARY